jgi:hypothetical protein
MFCNLLIINAKKCFVSKFATKTIYSSSLSNLPMLIMLVANIANAASAYIISPFPCNQRKPQAYRVRLCL